MNCIARGLPVCVVLFALPTIASAWDDLKGREYVKQALEDKANRVATLKRDLEAMTKRLDEFVRSGKKKPKGKLLPGAEMFLPSDKEAKKGRAKRAKELKAEIERMKKVVSEAEKENASAVLELDDLAVGRLGQIQRSIYIAQVIGPTEFRASSSSDPSKGQDFIVRGMSTAELADDTSIELETPFEVTGTTTYVTILGATRTVPVIEPFDMEHIKPFADELSPATQAPTKGKPAVPGRKRPVKDAKERSKAESQK